jgi:hypothetical protein
LREEVRSLGTGTARWFEDAEGFGFVTPGERRLAVIHVAARGRGPSSSSPGGLERGGAWAAPAATRVDRRREGAVAVKEEKLDTSGTARPELGFTTHRGGA